MNAIERGLIDPVLQVPVSRRKLLIAAGTGGIGLVLSPLLVACARPQETPMKSPVLPTAAARVKPAPTETPKSVEKGWKPFTSTSVPGAHYEIYIPPQWSVGIASGPSQYPQRPQHLDMYNTGELTLVYISSEPATLKLEEYRTNFKAKISSREQLTETRIKVAGQDAWEFHVRKEPGSLPQEIITIFFIAKDRAWSISGVFYKEPKLDIFRKIASTFEFR